MKICSDLFSSTLEFQVLKKNLLKIFYKNYSDTKIIDVDSQYFKRNKEEFEIYWGNRLTIKVASNLPNLKWIHYAGSGMSRELLKYSEKRKIKVTNTRNIFDKAVAATILAYIFMLGRGIHYSLNLKHKKKLNRDFYNKLTPYIQSIFSQKILFVGYGNIAQKVAKVCKSADMQIYAIKSKIPKKKTSIKFFKISQLKIVVKKVDFIINLLPSTKLTKNTFDKKIFNQMKKSAIFINAGRGDTVNENDLINAISKKKLLAAGLDVVKKEPIKNNSKILKFENIFVTPHIAGITNEFWDHQFKLFANNLKRYRRSNKLINLIDLKKEY